MSNEEVLRRLRPEDKVIVASCGGLNVMREWFGGDSFCNKWIVYIIQMVAEMRKERGA